MCEEEKRAQVTSGAEDTAPEVKRLQVVLSDTLDELQRLRAEHEHLTRRYQQEQARSERVTQESFQARKESKQMKRRAEKAERRVQVLEQRLSRTEAKYRALADSKLGRLTLQYWEHQKRTGRKGLGDAFFIRWLFNRLPSISVESNQVEPIEMAKSGKQAGSGAERASAVQKQPAAKQEPATAEMKPEQIHWAEQFGPLLEKMGESNGIRYYEKLPYRIGLICDEFFYESICDAAQFVYVTPDNWRQALEEGLDAFLFVTAWRGLHEEWRGLGNVNGIGLRGLSPQRDAALDILEECRRRGIPTAFYSKEDPPNYELFLDFAKACDYVFTTAQECIPYYQQDCGQERVAALSFNINPRSHNPIGCRLWNGEGDVLFSGSWMRKYPDRCMELAVLFDGILRADHGLHIVDRNYPSNPRHAFPEPYFSHATPALPHETLQKLHKLFDWAVNINSVKGSRTMFANRAFELQANGVLMLSNFSVGVNRMLPTVLMAQERDEVGRILDSFTPEERYERQMWGVRSVMTGHTCFDRLGQLLQTMGLKAEQPRRRILVLSDALTDQVKACFARQTYPDKELMAAEQATVQVVAEYDMVAWFHPEAEYGAFYLEDMANGFKYTTCDYVTKSAWYEGDVLHQGVEHDYVEQMDSKYRTVFWQAAFQPEFLLDGTPCQLPNGYSIDHFGYREGAVPQQPRTEAYKLTVVVPVCGNGWHLYGKCFASLRRSSLFQDMEILLVDGAGNGGYSWKMAEELARCYPNVTALGAEGPAGAVHARNRGAAAATAPYVAFLDPESEAVSDGYARLYQIAVEQELDVALGNIYVCDVENRVEDYYAGLMDAMSTQRFEEGFGQGLRLTGFHPADLQAMVIRRSLIRNNGLFMVEDAQEAVSLFTWQVLQAARRIEAVDLSVVLEYPSGTDKPADYLEKLLRLQGPKVDWLKQVGLLEAYMETGFAREAEAQVLTGVCLTPEGNRPAAAELAEQILAVYRPWYAGGVPLIDEFLEKCRVKDYVGAAELACQSLLPQPVRPMLTVEDLRGDGGQAKLQVEYRQKDGTLTFVNQTQTQPGALYAWVVLLAGDTYQKVFESKYTAQREFSRDFSTMAPQYYRVKAFVKQADGSKVSENTALIQVAQDSVRLIEAQSYAKAAGKKE